MKLVLAGLTLALSACSVTTTFETECSVDSDCDNTLKCVERLCVKVGAGGSGGMGGMGGSGGMEPTGFLTETCNAVSGVPVDKALDPNTILIGSLLPRSGKLAEAGPAREKAIALAIDEINQSGGISPKRFAVVHCDSGTNGDQAVEAANWLINTAKVQAIIGAASSSVTIQVANEVTIPSGILLISSSSTSPAITDLPDQDLVWRTAPSDTTQGAAIAEHLWALGAGKVAVINRDDAYGNGLGNTIQEKFCGESDCRDEGPFQYLSRTYVDDDADPDSILRVLRAVDGFEPDAVVLIAYLADGLRFLKLASADIDHFILTDSLKKSDLLSIVGDARPALQKVFGTAPASPGGQLFLEFFDSYTSKWGQEPKSFNAQTYDAMYLVAYAYAAAGIEPEPDGAGLAAAMKRLSAGKIVEAGRANWNLGVSTLQASANATLNFVGASGALDFNPDKGEAPADIEGWRLDLENSEIVSTGVLYTADKMYVPLVESE